MRFELWNVGGLNRAGSLMTVSRELSNYKLFLVGVQEVRWEGDDTEPAGDFSTKRGMRIMNYILFFFVRRRIY
jgi:hypothetical protein